MICALIHTSHTKVRSSSRVSHRAAAVAKRLEALDLTCLVTASTLGLAVISALTMTTLGTL